MRRSLTFLCLIALAVAAPALSTRAESDNGTINIMRPEPGSHAAKHTRKKRHEKSHRAAHHYKARRALGSSNPVYPVPLTGPQKPLAAPHNPYGASPQRAETPPPLVVPETGRVLPNLPPSGAGLGPGGTESFQQRAARCHQQAGIYGQSAGNPSTYINSCINQ